MTDTVIKEDYKFRKLAGGALILIGLPLTLLMSFLALSGTRSLADIGILLPGLALIAGGLWGLFPQHPPRARIVINDESITLTKPYAVIPLDALRLIRRHTPIYSKHPRLTFTTDDDDLIFDVVNLTHKAADILNLISMRMEKGGAFLKEGKTDIRGAPNGIWKVHSGPAFEAGPKSATIGDGRE
jgi:hypothetical protein